MDTSQMVQILLVEDDPGDVELIMEGLKESKIAINFKVIEDGVKALQYLHKEQPYQNCSLPDLILLDLNLPKMDGREVLKEIKGDPFLRQIPVVILTTSDAETDIVKSYTLGANCYITKPISLDGFIEVVQTIEGFWLTVVKLPSTKRER